MIGFADITESATVSESPIDPFDLVTAMTTESRLVEHVLQVRNGPLSNGFGGDGTMGTESIIYARSSCEGFIWEQLLTASLRQKIDDDLSKKDFFSSDSCAVGADGVLCVRTG